MSSKDVPARIVSIVRVRPPAAVPPCAPPPRAHSTSRFAKIEVHEGNDLCRPEPSLGSSTAMGGHDPGRKRGSWRQARRTKTKDRHAEALNEVAAMYDNGSLGVDVDECSTERRAICKALAQMAPKLWESDFKPLLNAEMNELADTGLLGAAVELKTTATLSTYRRRGLTRNKESRLAMDLKQASEMGAAAARQSNQQLYPFSICARSVAMLMRRTPEKDWTELLRKRMVLSKPTTRKLVKLMLQCRPKPLFEPYELVAFHIFDQTHRNKGATRAKHKAAEQVDADGSLVALISMTIINSITIPIPCTLGGGISQADFNALVTTGPYTKPFSCVLEIVEPDRVKASTYAMMKDVGSWLQQASRRFGVDISAMKVAHVARAAIGRPNVQGGRAYLHVNAPIINCNTKSYSDMIRICHFHEQLRVDSSALPKWSVPPVMIMLGDGQSMLRMKDLKKSHPDRYRHVLVASGNFHVFGHFMFGCHESWHDCFTGFWATLLHKSRVPKHIPDFDDDGYRHILAHHVECTVGTLTYLLHDVEDPPPSLLLTDPLLYELSIKHAGGLVAFKYLQYVGIPVLEFLRAGRTSDGGMCEQLHALSFHMNRSSTHKVNCVFISLLALWSTCSTHPAIASIIKATVSFSITGRTGSLMYGDRILEWINLIQGLRDGKFSSFEKGMQYTPDLAAMLHAAHAWDCAEHGESSLHDPLKQSTLNAAEVIRAEIHRKLGSDLTIPSEYNPFWHTGNPVKLYSGPRREYRPWMDYWDVAAGRVPGKGRADTEEYAAYIRRIIRDSMFPSGASES